MQADHYQRKGKKLFRFEATGWNQYTVKKSNRGSVEMSFRYKRVEHNDEENLEMWRETGSLGQKQPWACEKEHRKG